MQIRILKRSPFEVVYADFTYRIEPVTDGVTSYIAARLLDSHGKLIEPVHEYALSRKQLSPDGAREQWSSGFETVEDFFLQRELIERLLDREWAEEVEEEVPGEAEEENAEESESFKTAAS